MRRLRFVIGCALLLAAGPWAPAGTADPAPWACIAPNSGPEPILGDGLQPGDVGNENGLLVYGCYTARLSDPSDIDGYWANPGGPGTITVTVLEDCAQVDWRYDIPARHWFATLCEGESWGVSTHHIEIMRFHIQRADTTQGPVPYVIEYLPDLS